MIPANYRISEIPVMYMLAHHAHLHDLFFHIGENNGRYFGAGFDCDETEAHMDAPHWERYVALAWYVPA